MSYLGRRGASAALTSADIPNDSITAAKIVDGAVTSDLVYLENKATTQNLSGTYSTERMYLNDSYTLTGDVTVTGHLALGSIADADVVITQDSTERTITGSGTLESGELMVSEKTDLTGMTGVLGSTVTGSPAITGFGTVTSGTLGSGVTFPAGMIIQTVTDRTDSAYNSTNATGQATDLACTIVRKSASSKYLFTISAQMTTLSANVRGGLRIKDSNSSTIHSWMSVQNWGDAMTAHCCFRCIIETPPSGPETYTVWTHSESSTTFWFNYGSITGDALMTIEEILE